MRRTHVGTLLASFVPSELGSKVGRSAAAVINWQRGVSIPPRNMISPIAEATGIPEEQLRDAFAKDFLKKYGR